MTKAQGRAKVVPKTTVLAFCAAFLPGFKAGGPIRSMVETLESQPPHIRILLITRDRDVGDTVAYPNLSGRIVRYGQHRVFYLNTRSPSQWARLLQMSRGAAPELIYVNSLWEPRFAILPVLARAAGIIRARELLLAPRGELSAGALQVKESKKRAFMRLWEPVLRKANPVFLASTSHEQSDILNTFPWARTVVRINTRGPEPLAGAVRSQAVARLVFVSRISPTKNLKCALESMMQVKSDIVFHIFGPIEDPRYWSECTDLIRQLPDNIRVEHKGTLQPGSVRTTFASYDAFVFPTLFENFGHVILESLSSGCPVVCSDRTPWTATLMEGAGEIVATFNSIAWAAAIERRARMSPDQRTSAKRDALKGYAHWRDQQVRGSAIESLLSGTLTNEAPGPTRPPRHGPESRGLASPSTTTAGDFPGGT